jgi:hypothetical protein
MRSDVYTFDLVLVTGHKGEVHGDSVENVTDNIDVETRVAAEEVSEDD